MVNAGAITLCSHLTGNTEDKIAWIEGWMEKLFNSNLYLNPKVLASERRTGDRNRSIAYLLKSNGMLRGEVDNTLEAYFSLCSFEASISQASYLPMLLANSGKAPDGTVVFSEHTARYVMAIMATCGLYNETGTYMVRCGLPGKSGVSGLIIAAAPRTAGIAVASPRVNNKGTSLRGTIMLEHIAQRMDWHFV